MSLFKRNKTEKSQAENEETKAESKKTVSGLKLRGMKKVHVQAAPSEETLKKISREEVEENLSADEAVKAGSGIEPPQMPKRTLSSARAHNVAGSLDEQGRFSFPEKGPGEIDLDDIEGLKKLIDNDINIDSEKKESVKDIEKTLLSVEISKQKGVSIVGDQICVPGRVPLAPVTLFEILFTVIGFSAGLIHFSVMAPNYLLSLFVVTFIMVVQILIYHTSYRAMRTVMTVIQTLSTLGIMALVGWAYADLIINPPKPEYKHFFLGIALIGFSLVPATMLAHLVYLGRSHRWIYIKSK